MRPPHAGTERVAAARVASADGGDLVASRVMRFGVLSSGQASHPQSIGGPSLPPMLCRCDSCTEERTPTRMTRDATRSPPSALATLAVASRRRRRKRTLDDQTRRACAQPWLPSDHGPCAEVNEIEPRAPRALSSLRKSLCVSVSLACDLVVRECSPQTLPCVICGGLRSGLLQEAPSTVLIQPLAQNAPFVSAFG